MNALFISECKNYKSLTDSTRKLNVPATTSTKRADTLRGSYRSVDWKGEGWYRVMGDAGTRIPEYPFTSVQSPGYGHCKNYCPGYLPRGSHPQTPGKLVYNVKVCYNCDGYMCHPSYKNFNSIKIRHCGDYLQSALHVRSISVISSCLSNSDHYDRFNHHDNNYEH